tara:strand:- start:462 stop:1799 length:1338 start_codon:yes stop_codon:yes gene_type:complete
MTTQCSCVAKHPCLESAHRVHAYEVNGLAAAFCASEQMVLLASEELVDGTADPFPLFLGSCFAFLSQLSSIGKGLQKVGVQTLPELSLRPAVLFQYAGSRAWRNGMLLDATGALFGLVSLTIVPISVAQPIFCNGLVLLALYSHCCLKEKLRRREWLSIGLCFVGTLLLAVTLVPRDWARTDIRWMQAKLALTLVLVVPLLVLLEMSLRWYKGARGVPNRSAIELLTGLQAGLCIGVGNASLASGLQSTSKSWLEHVEAQSSREASATAASSGVYVHLWLAAAFVVLGGLLNVMHPFFANRGYQHGRVVLISTYTALMSMATGVLMGMGVLDEAWPDQPLMSMLRHSAFGLISGGVLILNWNNFRALTGGKGSGKGSGWGRDCCESPHSSGRDSAAERGGATPTRRATAEDGGAGIPVCPMLPPNVECQHRERTPTLSASDPGKV